MLGRDAGGAVKVKIPGEDIALLEVIGAAGPRGRPGESAVEVADGVSVGRTAVAAVFLGQDAIPISTGAQVELGVVGIATAHADANKRGRTGQLVFASGVGRQRAVQMSRVG